MRVAPNYLENDVDLSDIMQSRQRAPKRSRHLWSGDSQRAEEEIDDFSMHAMNGAAFNQALEAIEAEEDEEEEVREWEYCELPTRTQELEVLGEAGERSRCFGCVYIGERSSASVDVAEIKALIETARMSMGRADMVTVAKALARQYEAFRRRTNRNLIGNDKPLPVWPASMILDHLRNHHQDPEMMQVVVLSEIQELRARVLGSCLKKSRKTGKTVADKDQVAAYEKLVKLQIHVQKQKPEQMAFYSAGAHVEPTNLSQGVISYKTKRLHDHWKNSKH